MLLNKIEKSFFPKDSVYLDGNVLKTESLTFRNARYENKTDIQQTDLNNIGYKSDNDGCFAILNCITDQYIYWLEKPLGRLLVVDEQTMLEPENLYLKFYQYARRNNKNKFVLTDEANKDFYTFQYHGGRFYSYEDFKMLHGKESYFFKKTHTGCHEIAARIEEGNTLLLGLGNPGLYDHGFSLHRIYGCPYIAGSAVQGAFRNFIIRMKFEGDEIMAKENELFSLIFGLQNNTHENEKRGAVDFWHAYPTELTRDSFTTYTISHSFKNEDSEYPNDSGTPTILSFPALQNTTFIFRLGLHAGMDDEIIKDKFYNPENLPISQLAEQWFKEFLFAPLGAGIGAKTHNNRGHFSSIELPF